MAIQVVILAAGKSKRMHAKSPKVLHLLGGKPILEHVITTATQLTETTPIIIFGHQGETLQYALSHHEVKWVLQKEQLGTGHALLQAIPYLKPEDQVLVLCGDVPLISVATLKNLIDVTPPNHLGMLTANLPAPNGYGRIKRDQAGRIVSIVEEKDAQGIEQTITEINTGIYLLPHTNLKRWLTRLTTNNQQNEYYLTDIIALASEDHIPIHSVQPLLTEEILGVNDKLQLANLERFYQRQYAEKLLRAGVTITDPNRLDIRGEVQVGHDVFIDVNVIIEGRCIIGNDCMIGPNVILRNTILRDRTIVQANSIIDGAEIAADCMIGPFARIRPGTIISARAHIGNFVEIKNSEIGMGSKVNHLSYIGDSFVGKQVNIGAGTITCNYDGMNKHKTTIGDGAFIGSCSQLVAPVTIGEEATIGAGSTITRDAPPGKLTLARVPQKTIDGWERGRHKASEEE